MAQYPSPSRVCGAFILAILALAAAFSPAAQGQEVRRAKPLTEVDRVFAARRETLKQEKQRLEANQAEQRAITAAIARLNAQAAYIRSMPTSEYKIQAWDRLLAEQDRVSDWQDRAYRRMDNDQAWADQNEIACQNQLAAASAASPEPDFSDLGGRRVNTPAPEPASTPDPYQDLIDAAKQQHASRGLSDADVGLPGAAREDRKDCLIVATEAFARLEKSAYWAQIAGFTWFENNKKLGGHAVVFYQPTQNMNVWMYDRGGSLDLQTRSHDLNEIITALNRQTRKNLRVESPKWLESEDSRKDFAPGASAQQPVWAKTGAMSSEQSGGLVGRLIGGLTMCAYVAVIFYLKGQQEDL